jgi:hypothetical protein
VLALTVLLAAGACGGPKAPPANVVTGPDPMNPCADSQGAAVVFGANAVVLDCARAVEIANTRLGLVHWPIESIEFHRSMCPPNARCRLGLHEGWVVYEFWSGDPVMIRVGAVFVGDVMSQDFVAGEPEPLPDWLLEHRASP